MTTHFHRVRRDFAEERARCFEDRYWNAPHKARDEPCRLPDECKFCKHWVCNACERVVPWSDGSDGDGGMLCDGCWCRYIEDWLALQATIEEENLWAYTNACAL